MEIDRLKSVLRQSRLIHESRRENSAEHSWHLALLAMILSEYSAEPIDVGHVITLVLIHDIVEIDAGDTYAYDTVGFHDKAEREERAAARIFGLLPTDQAREVHALWHEFEAGTTAAARFAHTLDRLMPLLHNYMAEGTVWHEHGITAAQVQARNAGVAATSPALAAVVHALIVDAMQQGYLSV